MSSRRLEGKTALVTGGSTGLGLATARRFVAEGATVFITGRRDAELQKAVTDIGGRVVAIRADSSNIQDLHRALDTVKANSGKLDIVFANAGILERQPIGQITEDSVDRLLSVNVKGVIFTVQTALPLLVDGGSVILTSSLVAHRGMSGNSVYACHQGRNSKFRTRLDGRSEGASDPCQCDQSRRDRYARAARRGAGCCRGTRHAGLLCEVSARGPGRIGGRHRRSGGLLGLRCVTVCERSGPPGRWWLGPGVGLEKRRRSAE